MHRPHRGAFSARNLNTVSDDGGAKAAAGGASERGGNGTGDWPFEVAAEGADGQGGRGAGWRRRDRSLELELRRLQLAHVLCRLVAALIQLFDQAIARGHRGVERGPRAGRGLLRGQAGLALLLDLGHHGAFGGHGAAVRLEPHAVQFRHCRDAAAQPSKRAHIVRRQEQFDVAAAPALGELHQAVGDAWSLGDARGFEGLEPPGGVGQARGHCGEGRIGLRQLLALDGPLELELAEIAKHAARLRGQPIGFRLQGLAI